MCSRSNAFFAHLEAQGASFDEIIEVVDRICPEAGVVATGSIPDSRGNRLSDIDLLLLHPDAEQKLRQLFHVDHDCMIEHPTRLSTGQEVHFYTVTGEARANIRERLQRCGDLLRNPSVEKIGVPLLARHTYVLLDDIATGVALRYQQHFDDLKHELCLQDIPDHILLLALTEYFVVREDSVGHFERGAAECALLLLREAALYLSEAMLASLGNGNTRLQWRLVFLERARDALGDDAVDGIKSFILDNAQPDAQTRERLQGFFDFANGQMGQILQRSSHLLPVFMRLSQQQQFVLDLPE